MVESHGQSAREMFDKGADDPCRNKLKANNKKKKRKMATNNEFEACCKANETESQFLSLLRYSSLSSPLLSSLSLSLSLGGKEEGKDVRRRKKRKVRMWVSKVFSLPFMDVC